jgi:PmbA protein
VEKVGFEAARIAVSALNPGKAEDGRYTIILGQPALLDLLSHTFIPALKADNIHRGKSPLKGRIGEKIASETLTVTDEGLMAGGLSTWSFDDEGSPSRNTPIIVKGSLKGYLYDHYYASIDNVESSGNARRGLASYASTPKIEPTNLKIEKSQKSCEALLAEVERGFYVPFLQGAQSSNPESGEFSVVAAPAWKIECGSLTKPIRALMLTGNIYELLENVSGTASNLRDVGILVAPWVRFEDVGVVGG